MDRRGEQDKFDLQPVIEQRSYQADTPSAGFLDEWLHINDSIKRVSVPREEWDALHKEQALKSNGDGSYTLFLPYDGLALWEMVPVMKSVEETAIPGVASDIPHEAVDRMRTLGEVIKNAGMYLASRIDKIEQGKSLAWAAASDFYAYGRRLSQGEGWQDSKKENQTLTPEQTRQIDFWLATGRVFSGEEIGILDMYLRGENERLTPAQQLSARSLEMMLPRDNVYVRAMRGKRGQENIDEESVEDYRQKKLAQFFRVSEKAFALDTRAHESGETTEASSEEEIAEKIAAWTAYQRFLGREHMSEKEQEEKVSLESILFMRKPWERKTPVHAAFLHRIEGAIARQVEAPRREFEGSLVRRGMELLKHSIGFDRIAQELKSIDGVDFSKLSVEEMKKVDEMQWFIDNIMQKREDKPPEERQDLHTTLVSAFERRRIKLVNLFSNILHWENGETTLREALKIDEMKAELEAVRKSGDRVAVANKEREIIDKIQQAISAYPRRAKASNPSEMVAFQHLNCVGASVLGSAFLSELGITHLVGSVPGHSVLVVITRDGRLEWRDMIMTTNDEELSDEMIKGAARDGKPLTTQEIIAYATHPFSEGLVVDISSDTKRKQLLINDTGQRLHLSLYAPELGQRIQVLRNTAFLLLHIGMSEYGDEKKKNYYEQAIHAFKHTMNADTSNPLSYGIGIAMRMRGSAELERAQRKEYFHQAIEVFRQVIAIDPKDFLLYSLLGDVLIKLCEAEHNADMRNENLAQAIEAYQKAIMMNSVSKNSWFGLGEVFLHYSMGGHTPANERGYLLHTIDAFRQFLSLADMKKDDIRILVVTKAIKELQTDLDEKTV